MKDSSFTIRVYFKRPRTLKRCLLDGRCDFDGKDFKIYIDKNLSLIDQIGIFFHEITHLVCFYFFHQELEEKKEEKCCDRIKDISKRHITKLITGGKI